MDTLGFHLFSEEEGRGPFPERFTCPFHYTPHPLCVLAAGKVQAYLEHQPEGREGKMFGVLVVRREDGRTGFLVAFSGMLEHCGRPDYFVPPIYDLQQPGGFFQPEEAGISALNREIDSLENSAFYLKCKRVAARGRELADEVQETARRALLAARAERGRKRENHADAALLLLLEKESQHQKAAFRRLKQHWRRRLGLLEMRLDLFRRRIEELKSDRKRRSAVLQQKLFGQFKLLNARGEVKDLCTVFREAGRGVPPAGAGECAAPKLLQYAYVHHLHPLAMAEFWWGDSPKSEIRRQGYYYPACMEKCGPILTYMLQGLEVDAAPEFCLPASSCEFEILYEDDWLAVVNKPAGLLSVPGKSAAPSLFGLLRERWPEAGGPLLVHRLDMDTSGLVLAAKTKEVHKQLQSLFCCHAVKKRYVALLDGFLPSSCGTVDLPLCPDPHDRPRQMVSAEYGKPAQTRYCALERRIPVRQTLVAFYPETGRTHQIRVHAAHPQGLDCPVVGDRLYGRPADRLYLHAEALEFVHPVTGKILRIEKKAGF